MIALKKHEATDCHKEAVLGAMKLPASCPDVGEILSLQHAKLKKENKECILKIISNLNFLARQGLRLCGDGDNSNSNFIQLMRHCTKDDKQLATWLEKKTYTCPTMSRTSC